MNYKYIIAALGLVIVSVVCLVNSPSNKDLEKMRNEGFPEPKTEVIQPNTTGTIEVFAEGVEDFSYTGEIDIRNDGKNGEPIEIVVEVH